MVAQCKAPLQPLIEGADMGALLSWAVYATGRFNKCQAAALGSAD